MASAALRAAGKSLAQSLCDPLRAARQEQEEANYLQMNTFIPAVDPDRCQRSRGKRSVAGESVLAAGLRWQRVHVCLLKQC